MSETTTLDPQTQTPPPESAEAPAPADVTPPSQVQDEQTQELPADGDAYLKSLEGDDGAEKPKPAPRPVDFGRLAENRETLRRRAAERQEKIEAAVNFDELVPYGVPQAAAEATQRKIVALLKPIFNDHNSDWASLGHAPAALEAVETVQQNIATGMQRGLEAPVYKAVNEWLEDRWAQQQNPPWEDVFGQIATAARQGYVPKSSLKKAYEDGILKGRADAEKVAPARSSQPLGVNGNTARMNSNVKSAEENDRAFNNHEIDRETWKANNERFRGSKA